MGWFADEAEDEYGWRYKRDVDGRFRLDFGAPHAGFGSVIAGILGSKLRAKDYSGRDLSSADGRPLYVSRADQGGSRDGAVGPREEWNPRHGPLSPFVKSTSSIAGIPVPVHLYRAEHWTGKVDDSIENNHETAISCHTESPSSHPGSYQVWINGRNTGYASSLQDAVASLRQSWWHPTGPPFSFKPFDYLEWQTLCVAPCCLYRLVMTSAGTGPSRQSLAALYESVRQASVNSTEFGAQWVASFEAEPKRWFEISDPAKGPPEKTLSDASGLLDRLGADSAKAWRESWVSILESVADAARSGASDAAGLERTVLAVRMLLASDPKPTGE